MLNPLTSFLQVDNFLERLKTDASLSETKKLSKCETASVEIRNHFVEFFKLILILDN